MDDEAGARCVRRFCRALAFAAGDAAPAMQRGGMMLLPLCRVVNHRLGQALLGLVLSGAAAAAEPPPDRALLANAVAALCAGAAPVAAGLPDPDTLADRLRDDGDAVRDAACASWPAATGALAHQLALLLVEVGLPGPQRGAAIELLRRLAEPDAEAPASLRAAWHLANGRHSFEAGMPPQALAHFSQARAALLQAGRGHSPTFVRALIRLAHAQRGTQQVDAAAASLDEAERLIAALNRPMALEWADLHNARTMVAYSRLDREAVVRHARAEIEALRLAGRGDSPSVLHALGNLGGILSQLERPAEAEAALREGLRLMALHPEAAAPAQVGILVNLAALQLTAGQYAAAAETADRGVQTAARFFGANGLRQVVSLVQRAKANTRLGRWELALADYGRSEALVRQQPGGATRERLVWIREGQADVYGLLGDEDGLLAALEDGLAQSSGTASLRRWRGALLRGQGVYLARRQQWAAAERAFAEGAAVFADLFGPDHAQTLELRAALCTVQLRAGKPGAACVDLVERADAGHGVPGATPRLRHALHAALALQAQAESNTARAQHHLLQALAAAQLLGGPLPLWEALDALAVELRRQGRREAAVFFGKQSVQAIEALRASVHRAAASREGAFLVDKLEVYRRLAAWLAADDRLPEALEVMRLLREEEFHQFMLRDGSLLGRDGRTLLTPHEQALARTWAELSAVPAADLPDQADAWAAALKVLVEQAPAGAAAAGRAKPPAWPAAPPAGELRVTTIAGHEGVTLVLESARARRSHFVAWPRAEQAAQVAELLSRLDAGADALVLLQALYRRIGALIDAHARAAGAGRVVLALDGALRYLPFAALHDGRAPMAARLAFVRLGAAPSAAPAVPQALANSLQAFGSARGDGGLADLPSVGAELCAIVDGPVHHDGPQPPQGCTPEGRGRGPWPGRAWLDASFTAAQLERALAAGTRQAGGLLHLGTHFVLRPGNVARSWLRLGDGQRLHLNELGRLDFSGQRLVTLAACETALGAEQADGREVEGLSSLVLRRGAGAVLATLWRVDDRATRVLMQHFYGELRRHPPGRALQQAQAALRVAERGRWAAPRHWAGFVVVQR